MKRSPAIAVAFLLLLAVAVFAVVLEDGGDGGASPTPTRRAGPPDATIVPRSSVTDDKAVWEFVKEWAQGNVSPILRPSKPPVGVDTVAPMIYSIPGKEDHNIIGVVYAGQGKRLTIQAANGQTAMGVPGATPGVIQYQISIRGQTVFVHIRPDNIATATEPAGVWLMWIEGAMWGVDRPEPKKPQYVVTGKDSLPMRSSPWRSRWRLIPSAAAPR
jgi:hypothetical protein